MNTGAQEYIGDDDNASSSVDCFITMCITDAPKGGGRYVTYRARTERCHMVFYNFILFFLSLRLSRCDFDDIIQCSLFETHASGQRSIR